MTHNSDAAYMEALHRDAVNNIESVFPLEPCCEMRKETDVESDFEAIERSDERDPEPEEFEGLVDEVEMNLFDDTVEEDLLDGF